jgi:hypothetical protein
MMGSCVSSRTLRDGIAPKVESSSLEMQFLDAMENVHGCSCKVAFVAKRNI